MIHIDLISNKKQSKGGLGIKETITQWIINDNTVDCDKLDVKGLDVKRSSFPTYFKEVMKTVLLDILKSTDKTEIDQKILDYKDGMVDRNFIDIKNTSVKELSKYMTKVR